MDVELPGGTNSQAWRPYFVRDSSQETLTASHQLTQLDKPARKGACRPTGWVMSRDCAIRDSLGHQQLTTLSIRS